MIPDEYTHRPALPRGPVIDTSSYVASGDCPADDCDGTLWHAVHGIETVCGTCATVDAPVSTDLVARRQRTEDVGWTRQSHDTYSTGHRRCYGGYVDDTDFTEDDSAVKLSSNNDGLLAD